MSISIIVTILGMLIGIGGGVAGTYVSIRNTKSAAARRFMIRCAVYVWLALLIFVCALMLIPKPYNFLTWIPFALAMPLSIRYINARLMLLQRGDSLSTHP